MEALALIVKVDGWFTLITEMITTTLNKDCNIPENTAQWIAYAFIILVMIPIYLILLDVEFGKPKKKVESMVKIQLKTVKTTRIESLTATNSSYQKTKIEMDLITQDERVVVVAQPDDEPTDEKPTVAKLPLSVKVLFGLMTFFTWFIMVLYLIADNILPFDCAVRCTEDNTSKCRENSIVRLTLLGFCGITCLILIITALIGKIFSVHSKMTCSKPPILRDCLKVHQKEVNQESN